MRVEYLRWSLLPLLLSAAAPTLACGPLEGAWQLSYALYRDLQGKVVHEDVNGATRALKVLSPRHFSFITQAPDGKLVAAGAGTWSLQGDAYTEVLGYASSDQLMGKTYRFRCEMRDGTWIHSGREDHLLIEEHWTPARDAAAG